jgi:hypothetical protein
MTLNQEPTHKKTYLKTLNSRNLVMHIKMENPPCRFSCRDITPFNPSSDLVPLVLHLHPSHITPLLNVFEEVFEGGEGSGAFNINVAVVFSGEVRAVWDNAGIVCHKAANVVSTAVVWPIIFWIPILIHRSLVAERLGKVFGAAAILHAWRTGIGSSTRAMDHAFLDGRKKKRLCLRIRPPSPDRRIDIFWSKKLLARFQKNEHVDMRKAALLELNRINIRDHSPENACPR